MTIKKNWLNLLGVITLSLSISGCSAFDWLVYKPDVPQGNYLEPKKIEQLRVKMTKEQVEYLLGRPILRDSFANDTWYYVYHYKDGRDSSITHKELILHFDGEKLATVSGDYQLSPQFSTPLAQSNLPEVSTSIKPPRAPQSTN